MRAFFRNVRAFFYRLLPSGPPSCWQKKLAGFERRWGLEGEGFTKEGFVRILWRHVLPGIRPGKFLELQAGDGLVGSLGVWLEVPGSSWRVEAWEQRPWPFRDLRRNRPTTNIHEGRLTQWDSNAVKLQPAGITTRGAREASGVSRAIRQGAIRPGLVAIWNPTRRPVWEHRLRQHGYRLELVYHRMEFYRRIQQ